MNLSLQKNRFDVIFHN